MNKQFENITEITDSKTYHKATAYLNELIEQATAGGFLAQVNANNHFTAEIGRIGAMCADYESIYMQFKHLKVKSPLILSIEREMQKQALNQRQTAELLEVKENTFSQIMSGKRNVSMKMAKRLYKLFNIDPVTILEFS